MGRFMAGGLATGAGSTTEPQFGLVSTASGTGGALRLLKLYNTVAATVYMRLMLITAAGTPGSAYTAGKFDQNGPAPALTLLGLYTGAPTLTEIGEHFILPNIIGAAIFVPYGGPGLVVPKGAGTNYANGYALITDTTGTPAAVSATFEWEE